MAPIWLWWTVLKMLKFIRAGVINQLGYSNAATTMLENECDVKLRQNKISARRGNLGSLERSHAKNLIEYIRKTISTN